MAVRANDDGPPSRPIGYSLHMHEGAEPPLVDMGRVALEEHVNAGSHRQVVKSAGPSGGSGYRHVGEAFPGMGPLPGRGYPFHRQTAPSIVDA